MQGFTWSNEIFPVLILSSYLLSSLFKPVDILKKKINIIKTLITVLCCSLSMLVLYLFPQIYFVLVMLAIWGSVEIISSAVNKLNQNNDNGEKGTDKLLSSQEALKPLKEDISNKELLSSKEALKPSKEDISNKEPLSSKEALKPSKEDINLLSDHLNNQLLAYQQREKNYIQEISYLNQQLKGYQYQTDKNNKRETLLTQNAIKTSQAVQKTDAKEEIASIDKMEANSSVTNDVKLYLDKIDEHKREIENLVNQVSKLQENPRSSVSKSPETNVIKPRNTSVSNNSNEVKEYLKQVQKEGAEISPFLRSFLVPPK